MPVQIGARSHNFTDPTGLLSECHRRIEMFLSTLMVVAEAIDRSPTEDAARALASALRYFGEAAPKHTADEEDSLFPRLRQIRHAEIQAVFSKLEELEKEHLWAAPLHAEIERLGAKYLSTGSLAGSEVDEFRSAVRDLASMYKQHITVEDELVFPLAARVLSDAEKSTIAEEMASRRNVRVVTEITELRK
jgi:hemerythrin-like domain-containing protein